MPSSELYIGNLDPDTRSQELRDLFERYGNINRCEVKFGGSGTPSESRPRTSLLSSCFLAYSAAFGFVGFESSDDAEV